MSDLDRAIGALREYLETLQLDSPQRPSLSRTHADLLLQKYQRTLEASDLDDALHIHEEIIADRASEYSDRPTVVYNYALLLADKHSRTGTRADLDNAVRGLRGALESTETEHSHRPTLLGMLAGRTADRFLMSKELAHLDEAILVLDDLLEIIPPDSPDRVISLHQHANLHGKKYFVTGQISHLNEAIQDLRKAVAMAPPSDSVKFATLNSLGSMLGVKYEAVGGLKDLGESVNILKGVVKATPLDDQNRSTYLSNLGLSLRSTYKATGNMDSLQEGVLVAQDAVELAISDDPKHRDLAMFWNNVGQVHQDMYLRTGAMSDLEESIRVFKDAVKASAWNDPERSERSNNLGNSLALQYSRTRSMARLDDAIWAASDAIRAAPRAHPSRPLFLNNHAKHLLDRYERRRGKNDLNQAIQEFVEAVETARSTNPDSSDLGMFLNNLSGAYKERNLVGGGHDDFSRAVQCLEEAIAKTPTNHPDRAARLSNLGFLLLSGVQYEGPESLSSSRQSDSSVCVALSSFEEALDLSSASPTDRIGASRGILRCCLLTQDWDRAFKGLHKAICLLPALAPKLLPNRDKQHMLRQVAGLASSAAAVALEAGKDASVALGLLELGRGVMATSLEDMRVDVLDLTERQPELAKRFISLRDDLDFSAWRSGSVDRDHSRSWQAEAKRRYDASQAFEQLVAEIRHCEGFQNFLLPPGQEELQVAAKCGPVVVINVSERPSRCDAFLIQDQQIRHLPLPHLKFDAIENQATNAGFGNTKTLAWLWDVMARPILEALGFAGPPSDGNWSRMWWIPTGPLSRFPLHAAGLHQNDLSPTVLDRVISSYASSVKAILFRRRHRAGTLVDTNAQQALLVGMENTPGQSSLPFASKEIDFLRDLFNSMSVTAIEPSRRKADILSHLPACSFFHFAGHGHSDESDPSQSYLALEDWRNDKMTVGNLLELNIRGVSPFLAYLSACGTGQVKEDRLVDENIHLISACQLAGFRHVIGTLWEVRDMSCLEMSRITYETIRDGGSTDRSVCLGLHLASRALRDRWASSRPTARSAGNLAKKPAIEGDPRVIHASVGTQGVSREQEHEQMPRKVTLFDDEDEDEEAGETLYWVPYVHFGV